MSSLTLAAGSILIPAIGAGLAAGASAVALTSVGAFYGGVYAVKYSIEGVKALNEYTLQVKKEAEKRREAQLKRAQLANGKLVELCINVIAELEEKAEEQDSEFADEIMQLVSEVSKLQASSIPSAEADTKMIQSINDYGYSMLREILRRATEIQSRYAIEETEQNDNIAKVIENATITLQSEKTMTISFEKDLFPNATDLEKATLMERRQLVCTKIYDAINFFSRCSEIGMPTPMRAWYMKYLVNIENKLNSLYEADASSERLEKSIRKLEEIMANFETLFPTFEEDLRVYYDKYNRYHYLAETLKEHVRELASFENANEIEKEIIRLNERVKRFQFCQKRYEKLGSALYTCMAYDEELRKLGYTVFGKKELEILADKTFSTKNTQINGKTLPFYDWLENGAKTQLYELDNGCILQLIVHADGTTSIETIVPESMDSKETAVIAQKKHCSRLKQVQKNLRELWFIDCEFQEEHDAEMTLSESEWRNENREQNRAKISTIPGKINKKNIVGIQPAQYMK